MWQSDLTDCQSKASSDLSLSYEVQEINSVTWQNCWKLHVSFKQRLIIWFLKLKLCLVLIKMQQLQGSKNNIKKNWPCPLPCINTAQTNNNINFQSKCHSETGENVSVQSKTNCYCWWQPNIIFWNCYINSPLASPLTIHNSVPKFIIWTEEQDMDNNNHDNSLLDFLFWIKTFLLRATHCYEKTEKQNKISK